VTNPESPDSIACSVYKGDRKEDTYLFVESEREFERVPQSLKDLLGELSHVLDLELTPERKLAGADIVQVMHSLVESGYFLQMPPPDYNPDDLPI